MSLEKNLISGLRKSLLISLFSVLISCSSLQKSSITYTPKQVESSISKKDLVDYLLKYSGSNIIVFQEEHFSSGYYHNIYKVIPVQPYIAKDFNGHIGAIIFASKEKGLKALVEKAKTDSVETSYMLLPEYDLWINLVVSVKEAKIKRDTTLIEYVLDTVKQADFKHTHTDAEYLSWYSTDTINMFGPSLFFIPSLQDVKSYIQIANNYPEHRLTEEMVSSKGSLSMFMRSPEFSCTNRYAVKAFNDYCKYEFIFIRDHFKGTPIDSLEMKANSYNGDIKLKLEYSPEQ